MKNTITERDLEVISNNNTHLRIQEPNSDHKLENNTFGTNYQDDDENEVNN